MPPWAEQLKDKKFDEAVAIFTKVLTTTPDDADTVADRGYAYCELKQYDKATDDYTTLIRLQPTSAYAHRNRALCYNHAGDYTNACADYEEAARIAPDDPRSLNGLAWMLATCPAANVRDGARAVAYASKACERTGWKDGFYLDTLAAAYAESGHFADAIAMQEKAVALIADEEKADSQSRLELYRQHKPCRDQ